MVEIDYGFFNRLREANASLCPEPNGEWSANLIVPGLDDVTGWGGTPEDALRDVIKRKDKIKERGAGYDNIRII